MVKSSNLETVPSDAIVVLDEKLLSELSHKQTLHLSWLIIYGDDVEARKRSKVDIKTVRRWERNDENYVQCRNVIFQNKVQFAQETLKSLLVKATTVLNSLLDSADEQIQAKAVAMILAQYKVAAKDGSSQQVNVYGDVNFDSINRIRESVEFRAIVDGEYRDVTGDEGPETGTSP